MSRVRIIGAISSKNGMTLILENGTQKTMPVDSWHTRDVLDRIVGDLAVHKIVELDLGSMSIYAEVEEQTGGFLKIVRKTKGFVRGLLWGSDGKDEQSPKMVEILPPAPSQGVSGMTQLVPDPEEEETELVAIVKDEKTGDEVAIPGIEKLDRHIESAVRQHNVEGLKKFMERVATVAKTRPHTVQELLTFMERGDLPIAADGSIVAYKVLTSKSGSGPNDTYVDLHSRNVVQRVGSKVMQDESLIDKSRTECSTGLHIARRGYLRHFQGNVITIVKVAPEDIVAVPYGEPDKMRAAAYHIVGFLPKETHDCLYSNMPMTDNPAAAALLADVIAGNHIGVEEIVRIMKPMGGEIVVTPVGKSKAFTPGISGEAKSLDTDYTPVMPKEVREKAQAAIAKAAEEMTEVEEPQGEVPAITTAEPAEAKSEKAPTKKSKSKAKSKAKPKKPANTNTASPAEKTDVVPIGQLEEKYQIALKLHAEGKSGRFIAAELHMCRNKLAKLIKDYAA